MQDKMIENFNEQARQFFEPMRKLNSLMLNNMEKLSQYQMESMQRYSQMGTERMRDAGEVQSVDSLRDFGTRQAEMMNQLSQQMMEDAKALSEMSVEFKAEMETLFAEQAKAMGDAVKQPSAQAGKAETAKAQSSRGGSNKS